MNAMVLAQRDGKFREALLMDAGPVIRTGPNDLHFASPRALRQIYTQGNGAPLKAGFYQYAKPVKEDHLFSFTSVVLVT